MFRLLELTYENLVAVVKDRYGKGPFLAGALYGEFYKNLHSDAWQAEIIRNSKGLKDRLRQDWRFGPGQVIDEVHEGGLVKFVTVLTDVKMRLASYPTQILPKNFIKDQLYV